MNNCPHETIVSTLGGCCKDSQLLLNNYLVQRVTEVPSNHISYYKWKHNWNYDTSTQDLLYYPHYLWEGHRQTVHNICITTMCILCWKNVYGVRRTQKYKIQQSCSYVMHVPTSQAVEDMVPISCEGWKVHGFLPGHGSAALVTAFLLLELYSLDLLHFDPLIQRYCSNLWAVCSGLDGHILTMNLIPILGIW